MELALEYDHIQKSTHTTLAMLNLVFVLYYLFEQVLKLWALGWARYKYDRPNVFDGIVTVLLVVSTV